MYQMKNTAWHGMAWICMAWYWSDIYFSFLSLMGLRKEEWEVDR